ncbi:MAG: inorganic phosphate transporter, PiT family [Actinoplanes sp.]|nr:inorganic phosphate transporter, PiT family [Actinoplanes sp.]
MTATSVILAVVIFVVLLAAAGFMYLRSRRTPIDHNNVNDEWDGVPAPDERVPAGTAS